MIPQEYGKDFRNVNPPLSIVDVPEGTVSFALIMDDPDIPPQFGIPIITHWVAFNIPPTVSSIPEAWTVEGTKGAGTRGSLDYAGPRPPDKAHRYFFKLYALDCLLPLAEGATKEVVLEAMKGHVLGEAELMGKYEPTN